MPASAALYYPRIDIRDERWLRTAALFWDDLHTIVPSSYREPYHHDGSRQLFEEGILKPLWVDEDDPVVRALTGDFVEYLNSDEGRDFLRPRATRHELPSPQPFFRRSASVDAAAQEKPDAPHPFARSLTGLLHKQKLPREIQRVVDHLYTSHGEWYEVGAGFADFYMTLLATKLAERHGLALVTPSSVVDRLTASARSGRHDVFEEERRGMSLKPHVEGLAVEAVVTGLRIDSDVPIRDLLNFRRTHADELARFRSELGKLTSSIPLDEPLPAVRRHVQSIWQQQVSPALSALEAALRGNRIKYAAEGLLKVTFITAAQASLLVSAGLTTPVALAVGAGVSVVAVAALCSVEKDKALRESPYSYLLSVEKSFA